MLPAEMIHYNPANYQYHDTRKNDKAGICQKLQSGQIEPPVSTERRINIDKDKCKKRCEQNEPDNILLINQVSWYGFPEVNHSIFLVKDKFNVSRE